MPSDEAGAGAATGAPGATPLTVAHEKADLGQPLGKTVRFRFVKRVVYRACWFFLRHQVDANHGMADAISGVGADVARLQQDVAELEAQHRELAEYVKQELKELEALRPRSFSWGDLYLAFEDEFRGSSEEVTARLGEYLDDLRSLDRGDRPVLDVGCGRGDWLELLSKEGIRAYGVDLDAASVERAVAHGVSAVRGDAIDHLAGLPEGSLAVVTAFHLVEHLPIDASLVLLDAALAALMPGGLLVLETPNPENVLVGSHDFYLDPTHRNPLPPRLLAFLVGSRGFRNVQVRRLRRDSFAPAPTASLDTLDPAIAPVFALVQQRFTAGEDYAVIAERPLT